MLLEGWAVHEDPQGFPTEVHYVGSGQSIVDAAGEREGVTYSPWGAVYVRSME